MGGAVKSACALALAVVLSLTGAVTQSQARQDRAAPQASKKPAASKAAKKPPKKSRAEKNRVFKLGEVEVVGKEEEGGNTTVDRIYDSEMRLFDRNNLAAAADLAPGVTLSETGARNEETVYVRGFDIKHVPIFLDGVPIYVPYDGYPDLARFNTFNLSEVVISKAFTSVLYGPNTMGGAINMITRKPVKRFEVNAGSGYGTGNTYHGYANFGSNQGKWYIEGGGSCINSDYFNLPGGFTPTKVQGAGERVNSYRTDWEGNVKVGLTPNDTDEYALTYINQQAEKGVPPYTGTDKSQPVRYWQWPYWDVQNVHFNSNTAVCGKSYVRTTAFYDTFDNALYSYNNENYNRITYPPRYAFKSFYGDHTYGASVESGTQLLPKNFIKAAFHFKDDVHRQWETLPVQPVQRFEDRNYSVGLEDTIDFTKKFYTIVGASYDRVDTVEAQKLSKAGKLMSFPLGSADAFNPQIGFFYKLTDTGVLHATVARKSRLPSIKDKFSYRLGQALPNPYLGPERSTNCEVGYKDLLMPDLTFEANAFYYDVTDFILLETIPDPRFPGQTTEKNENVGHVDQYGFELGLTGRVLPSLKGGMNYTNIEYDNRSTNDRLTNIPHNKVFAYLQWFTPVKGLSALGSVEYNGDRYSSSDGVRVARRYALVNVKGIYEVRRGLWFEGGIDNVADESWSLDEGFPLQGRTYFVEMRYRH